MTVLSNQQSSAFHQPIESMHGVAVFSMDGEGSSDSDTVLKRASLTKEDKVRITPRQTPHSKPKQSPLPLLIDLSLSDD